MFLRSTKFLSILVTYIFQDLRLLNQNLNVCPSITKARFRGRQLHFSSRLISILVKRIFMKVRMVVERNRTSGPLAGSPQPVERRTAELHLSGRWLSVSPIIRIGLALRVNLSRILQNVLSLKLPVIGSSTVQCYGFYNFKSVVVEACTYCK